MPRSATASTAPSPLVAEHVSRAGVIGDYLATLPTRDLQAILRETPTLPLADLANQQDWRLDRERHRIWRDAFWKGSFAKDHPLGWDERLMAPATADDSPFVGGRFWKRFAKTGDGELSGYVVNYNLHALPGRSVVRTVLYPDDRRRYFKSGDAVHLMTYTNPPYRIVYDVIKLVAPDAGIGVMHLGTFPNGIEFATFLLSRHNYPVELMTAPDHDALFDSAETRAPATAELAGQWHGRIVFVKQPDRTLHNQFNPPFAALEMAPERTLQARVRLGLSTTRRSITPGPSVTRLDGGSASWDELRLLGNDTLLGRRLRRSSAGTETAWRYVLRRRSIDS